MEPNMGIFRSRFLMLIHLNYDKRVNYFLVESNSPLKHFAMLRGPLVQLRRISDVPLTHTCQVVVIQPFQNAST